MSVVYFLQAGDDGPIKIGHTTGPVSRRVHNLQIGSPTTIRILGVCAGDAALEAQLHEELAEHRIRGEWFRPHAQVLDLIELRRAPSAPSVRRGRLLVESAHPLRAFRERQTRPLSQEQLADLLGVERVTVWRWEAGTRKIRLGLLRDISEKTGIPPTALRPDLAKLVGVPVEAAQ